MKKIIACLLVGIFLACSATTSSAINDQRGGLLGFIAGCCFGVRSAGAYNDGKEIHWRQWLRLVPYVNIVFAIWDGIDGANGMTSKDYVEKYGAMYY